MMMRSPGCAFAEALAVVFSLLAFAVLILAFVLVAVVFLVVALPPAVFLALVFLPVVLLAGIVRLLPLSLASAYFFGVVRPPVSGWSGPQHDPDGTTQAVGKVIGEIMAEAGHYI
jgi:membrane protein implicated in regulation of membrane protease activity